MSKIVLKGKPYLIVTFSLLLLSYLFIQGQDNLSTVIFKVVLIIIAMLFTYISFFAYRLNSANQLVIHKLNNTIQSERKQTNMYKQLLKHSENLENEISSKTKELHMKRYTNIITGLPNRSKLLEESIFKKFTKMALLNIDNFKSINDIYGEEVGNVTLKITAVYLQKKIEDKNLTLYHIGGDEFAIISKEISNIHKERFISFIENILQEYKDENFSYRDKKLNLMMSSGISFSGRKKMLAYADMALKDAKKRNLHLSVFENEKELEKLHEDDIISHKNLIHALDNNNIISHFQPILPIKDLSKPTKYESLVRIEHTNGEILQPLTFLDVAKANRIYHKITKAVLENTLSVASKYSIPCSINISFSDIDDTSTMQIFFDTIEKYQQNDLITIELLETEDFINYKAVHNFCKKIRSYGLKVALDDFGSGYSNFAHILNLPVDYIKIDASLISNIGKDKNSRLMVETIVELAHKLNVETIAEFVSTQEILDIIKDIGIDYAQGFHIGKPKPIEDLISA